MIKENYPELFKLLTKPIYTFRFQDNKCEHSCRGPIIEIDQQGDVKKVRMDSDTLEPYIGNPNECRKAREAVKLFFNFTIDNKYQYFRKLDPGDLMIIENTRLLHGRTAFTAGSGKRRLQVCYLDRGEIISHMQVIKRTLINTDGYVFDDAGHFLMSVNT